jgi:hypothetical protein
MWGASPSAFLKAFPIRRGQPDLKNATKKHARLPLGTQIDPPVSATTGAARNAHRTHRYETSPICSRPVGMSTGCWHSKRTPGPLTNTPVSQKNQKHRYTLCYAVMLPGRKSAFRAGLRPGWHRESTKIDPPAGRRAHVGAFPVAVRQKSGPEDRSPARNHCCVTWDMRVRCALRAIPVVSDTGGCVNGRRTS